MATPRALDGIQAVDRKHVRMASAPEAFAGAILELLTDDDHRRSLELGARALHARDHSPDAVAEPLSQVFRGPARR